MRGRAGMSLDPGGEPGQQTATAGGRGEGVVSVAVENHQSAPKPMILTLEELPPQYEQTPGNPQSRHAQTRQQWRFGLAARDAKAHVNRLHRTAERLLDAC